MAEELFDNLEDIDLAIYLVPQVVAFCKHKKWHWAEMFLDYEKYQPITEETKKNKEIVLKIIRIIIPIYNNITNTI